MTQPAWRRSSRCDSGSCVDVAIEPGRVLVRNSQRPGTVVEFDADEFAALVAGIKAGEFDQ